ncbi:uroplakin-2 [Microcaecilia unicolor]|uniref:Uroplakin-2-like n=1 Tax=Microcaecilia unicolor TaxID=1415580 RepID=A0A6P7XTM2_9AMPH|nr:uroplakin-2-like [Microcaecilia unicolor]
MAILSWAWCTCLLFIVSLVCFSCDNLQIVDFPVSLYSRDSRLSTLLWLRPAYCFYEKWLMDAVDPTQVDRSTAAIEVQVKLADDNETYKLPQTYQVPSCSPIFQEPPSVLQFAYQMGPSIMWLNDSLVRNVLPGHSYRVRYVLYNQAKEQVVASNWSESFQTRDLPPSSRDMKPSLEGHSGGMVVITVLLSTSMFLLLIGLGLALGFGHH